MVLEEPTKQRRRKEVLGRDKKWFSLLFNKSNDAIFVHQPTPEAAPGKFIEVNDTACRRYGYSREEFLKLTPLDISAPENKDNTLSRMKRIFEEKNILFETVQIKKNGKKIPAEVHAHLFDLNGRPTIISIARDITIRKLRDEAEEELRRSEKRYRDIFEHIQDVYYEVTPDGIISEVSPSVEDVSCYKREELIGKSLYDIYVDPKRRDDFVRDILELGKVTDYEIILKDKNGSPAHCAVSAKLQRDRNGKPEKIIGSMRNITDRKQAEEQIQVLTQQILKAQENERQRISRELHDRVGQDLSSLKISCERLLSDKQALPDETRQVISESAKILEDTIVAIRDIAYDLRPPLLDQLGLVSAVYDYCEEFSKKHGIRVNFYSAGVDDLRLDLDKEIQLYRIVQEGLSNIKNHAEATCAEIRLVASFPKIILRMEDNGKGFDVGKRLIESVKEKRMGLRSMSERAKLLGGRMRCHSRRNEGTKIIITIPCKEKQGD